MISQEAKNFMLALEQCRPQKGMYWSGPIPQEIVELFDLKLSESSPFYQIGGVYVEVKPAYKAFTPKWLEKDGRE